MAKLPSFQFYPGDWLKDPALRRCSHAARGVYMDILCLMFECDERGVLATGGSAWTDEEVAGAVGGDHAVTLSHIHELLDKGVLARNQSGALYSRRMVRDEEKRRKCSEAGKRGGGNPTLKGQRKGGNKGPPKRIPKASTSSSTSTSEEKSYSSHSATSPGGDPELQQQAEELVELWNSTKGTRPCAGVSTLPLQELFDCLTQPAWTGNLRDALAKFPLRFFGDELVSIHFILSPDKVGKILNGAYDSPRPSGQNGSRPRGGVTRYELED